mgnify:CR=1 FL=1
MPSKSHASKGNSSAKSAAKPAAKKKAAPAKPVKKVAKAPTKIAKKPAAKSVAKKVPAKKAPAKKIEKKATAERPRFLTKAEIEARKAALAAELQKELAPKTSTGKEEKPAAGKTGGKVAKAQVDGEEVELEEVDLEDLESLEKELVSDNLEGVENIVDAETQKVIISFFESR